MPPPPPKDDKKVKQGRFIALDDGMDFEKTLITPYLDKMAEHCKEQRDKAQEKLNKIYGNLPNEKPSIIDLMSEKQKERARKECEGNYNQWIADFSSLEGEKAAWEQLRVKAETQRAEFPTRVTKYQEALEAFTKSHKH